MSVYKVPSGFIYLFLRCYEKMVGVFFFSSPEKKLCVYLDLFFCFVFKFKAVHKVVRRVNLFGFCR